MADEHAKWFDEQYQALCAKNGGWITDKDYKELLVQLLERYCKYDGTNRGNS